LVFGEDIGITSVGVRKEPFISRAKLGKGGGKTVDGVRQ